MNSRSEKIYKLNDLFNSLPEGKYISSSDLVRKLGWSRATVQRVIRELKKVYDAPIVTSRKINGGYQYDAVKKRTFELAGFWFSKEEISAIISLKSIIGPKTGPDLSGIFKDFWQKVDRLCEARGFSLSKWENKIKIISIFGRNIEEPVFRAITECLLNNTRLKIEYTKLSGIKNKREVSPIKLVRYRDNWYLDAWCHKARDLRLFALSRVDNVSIGKKPVKIVDEKKLKEYFTESFGIFTGKATKNALIKFTNIAAEEVSKEEWHPKQLGEFDSSGNYVLKIPYNNENELLMEVMKWGPDAEVLSPKSLRNKAKSLHLQASQSYS